MSRGVVVNLLFAGTLQYRRSACDKQCLPERRSGSKMFAGWTLRRVPAPLHPWLCRRDWWCFRRSSKNMLDAIQLYNEGRENVAPLQIKRIKELTVWYPLLPHGCSHKASCARPGCAVICIFLHPDTLTLRAERESARMSKITNDGSLRFGTGCFLAVPIMTTVGIKGLVSATKACLWFTYCINVLLIFHQR